MNILVTGGAGYIGSHAVRCIQKSGHNPVVVDNLYRGHRSAIPSGVTFHQIDIRETEKLAEILKIEKIDCVMHFAALAYVGESVDEPLLYYDNNTRGSVSLLMAMDKAGVKKLVFSSTCATYGIPDEMPIVETSRQEPINPYGWSKLFFERVLKDYAAANGDFGFIALRYFNVAGSSEDGSIGEDHEPETHLIPVILNTALGKRESITIFGEDYDTPDGTCVRDYIHVEDLVSAHVLAIEKIKPGTGEFFNLGIGRGYSVKEVVDAAKEVTGIDFKVEKGPRRPGDPPSLYANADKIRKELGFEPKHTDIKASIQTAWNWFQANPNGYGD